MRSLVPLAMTLVLGLSSLVAVAAESDETVAPEAIPEARSFDTHHRATFNGQAMEYEAIAGETYLRDKKGEPTATIFTFAYLKSGVEDPKTRPVTFVWNGGPGSASLWLHMGTFGPQRVSVDSDAGHGGAPPYDMIASPETILDVTDLVFVDPVGTGFSRALGEHEGKEFWGLTEDARSIAQFIRTWVTDNGRWNSPRFLMGESFGTTRAAAVAGILEGREMMSLNGIIFISQALDYAGSTPYVRDNIISHITYIPTMAATAWYHDRITPRPENLEAFLEESRVFAVEELLPALFKGNTLGSEERAGVRDRLAYFTGLSPEYIDRADLRVTGSRFLKELLRDEGLAVGRLDGRYTRDDIDDLEAEPESDAASNAISSAFKSTVMDYMRHELKVDWDRDYLAPSDPDLGRQWRWSPLPEGQSWEPWPVNTAHDLSRALRRNPSLRVLVASGYYDFATPFFDAEYTLNRHSIGADRVSYKYYEGGHMMYVNEPSRTQLLDDVREFIREQSGSE